MKQYLKLLMSREAKEVLGKHNSNLWLLTLVLVATFASIAFSEGSMIYLKDKMEDPFTNWVDIPIDGNNIRFKNFEEALNDPKVKKEFIYSDVHGDREEYYDMQGDKFLRCRHFSSVTLPLIRKILSKDNIVNGCVADSMVLQDKSLGLIVTIDAIKRLGFSSDSLPAYIYYKAYNTGADSLGLNLIEGKFFLVPLPVLAVVRRLPGNVDMMGTNYLSEQPYNDIIYPFDFNKHINYISELTYFFPNKIDLDEISMIVRGAFPDDLASRITCKNVSYPDVKTWEKGQQISIGYETDSIFMSSEQWLAIDAKIQELCSKYSPIRIYNYQTGDNNNVPNRYLSLTFNSLDKIRDFEEYAKNEHQVQIDMSQVASKENFNAVTVMAAILSSAMVMFSIVCIIMFLVNMLQSYFQKVKRNIGTFKAFGMNASELISVYVIILICIVCSAIVLSLLITWGIQILLPLIGVEKDGFNYLSLWNTTTYVALAVVLISTVVTVCAVMTNLLRQTPGNLIYDRN